MKEKNRVIPQGIGTKSSAIPTPVQGRHLGEKSQKAAPLARDTKKQQFGGSHINADKRVGGREMYNKEDRNK